MAKLYRAGRSIGGTGIGANSLSVVDGDLLSKSGGFVVKATNATGEIIGIAAGEQTFASNNQTVAQKRVQFVSDSNEVEYEITITGGTITQVDEGKFYNLNASGNVDGATETTTGSFVNTSDAGAATDAVVRMQVQMVKFISATKGIFKANK